MAAARTARKQQPTSAGAPARNGTRPDIPHDFDAEQALLGSALYWPEAAPLVAAHTNDFYWPPHGHIANAVAELHQQRHPVDPVTVADQLRHDGLWDRIASPDHKTEGADYLFHLLNVGRGASAHRHAELIAGHAHRRRLLAAINEAQHALTHHGDLDKTLDLLTTATAVTTRTGIGRPFEVVDLAALAEEPPPPPPLLTGWIYERRLTFIQGEPESGKTWFALLQVLEVLRAGHAVLYLDEEGGPDLIVNRLLTLGATPDELVALAYVPFPGRAWDATDLAALRHLCTELAALGRPVRLGVFDSLPDFLVAAGLDEDDSDDITDFVKRVCGVLRDAGAAQLILDHVTKAPGDGSRKHRSRYSRGSGAKLAKADAAILVETVVPLDIETGGRLQLWKTKDRPAQIQLPRLIPGTNPPPGRLYDATVTLGRLSFDEIAAADTGSHWEGPTECMAHVEDLLRSVPGQEFSQQQLIDFVQASRQANGRSYREKVIRLAAEQLAVEGRITVRVGARRARIYSWHPDQQTRQDQLNEEF